ncbi:MAG: anti-sigma factor [Candidatus Tectomicrobia bacterium]|nr:anti-sigma factor [Candidatus Tectomicrobia bacterium]
MRYHNPELREILAGEYMLGTLHGAARRRFEQLLREDAALRQSVEAWERRLNPLAEALQPVEPPQKVWQTLQQRIALPMAIRPSFWYRIEFWRPFGLITSAVALILLLYLRLAPSPELPPSYVAIISDSQGQPVWLVSVTKRSRQMTIEVLKPQQISLDKAFELWAVPKGQVPRSLGLIPSSGSQIITLPTQAGKALVDVIALAVSLEPTGGSPTGVATGPVLYQGAWLPLGEKN